MAANVLKNLSVRNLEVLKEKLDCHLVCLAEKKLNSENYNLCFNQEDELESFLLDKELLEYAIEANQLDENYYWQETHYNLIDGVYVPVTTTYQQLDNCIIKKTVKTEGNCTPQYFGLSEFIETHSGTETEYVSNIEFIYDSTLTDTVTSTALNVISTTGPTPTITTLGDFTYSVTFDQDMDYTVLLEHLVTLSNGVTIRSRVQYSTEDSVTNYIVILGEFSNNYLTVDAQPIDLTVATVNENLTYVTPATTSTPLQAGEVETVIIPGEQVYSNFYLKKDCINVAQRRTACPSGVSFVVDNLGASTVSVTVTMSHIFENLTPTSNTWSIFGFSGSPTITASTLNTFSVTTTFESYVLLKNIVTVNTGSTFEYIVQVDIDEFGAIGVISVVGYFDSSNRLYISEESLGISTSSGYVLVQSENQIYITEPFTTNRTYYGYFLELVGNPQFNYAQFLMEEPIFTESVAVDTETITYEGCECPSIKIYPCCLDKVVENINTI